MSNYENPLDNFRSHSYHFILTVANTTEAHRKMIDAAQNGGASFLQAVNGATLGSTVSFSGASAYLLVDTRRFSQFSITSFDMTHRYGTGDPQNPSVPVAAAKMRLIDTTGLSFFNFLMDVMKNKLQSTRASAFFMLSIVFTGHDDNNPQLTRTVSTCFIPLNLTKLEFEFTSSGSNFDMEFWETEGNPGAGIPQLVDLGDIQAISTEGNANTVNGMIQALENRLNQRSLQFYQKYTNEALKQAGDANQNFPGAGKLVQYMITVPEEWRNFKIDTAGKSENVEQVFLTKAAQAKQQLNDKVDAAKSSGDQAQVDAATKARSSYHAFSYTTSVPDAIKIILESSKEYLDLGSKENRINGTGFVHKTVLNVTSDSSTYIIHHDIYPHRIPKITEKGDVVPAGDASKGQRKLSNGQIQNLITYDYMFSGKNSHVLDMKVRFSPSSVVALDSDLDMGQQRFAENSSTGQKPDTVKETGLSKTTDFSPLIRPGEPIFPPMKTKDQQTNFTGLATEEYKKADADAHLKAKQEHTNTIATLQFLGSLHAEITIRGNPNIIRKYADRQVRGGIAKHPAIISSPDTLRSLQSAQLSSAVNDQLQKQVSSEKAQYYSSYVKPRINDALTPVGNDPLLHGSDISASPIFVKVNIFAPNVDFLGNQNQGDLFTNKFFYNGAYMVMLVTTNFEGGTFKHVFSLIPYDVDGSFSRQTTASITTPPKNIV